MCLKGALLFHFIRKRIFQKHQIEKCAFYMCILSNLQELKKIVKFQYQKCTASRINLIKNALHQKCTELRMHFIKNLLHWECTESRMHILKNVNF